MRFTHVCKLAAVAVLLAAGLALPARAQYLGTVGQASTVSPFTIPHTHAQTIIGPCTVSVTTNCIKMIGQVSHLVTLNTTPGTPCSVLLDGSADGVNWFTLAAIFFASHPSINGNTIVANGYYPLIRIKANPAGAVDCLAITGTYSGFQTPLSLSGLTTTASVAITTPANPFFPLVAPYIVSGFQCFNPNGSTAFLQLFDSATAPTLGTGFIYQIGIPAGQTFVYPGGNAFVGTKIFEAGASTTAGGNTAVSTALPCSFQLNFAGPFAPLTPASL